MKKLSQWETQEEIRMKKKKEQHIQETEREEKGTTHKQQETRSIRNSKLSNIALATMGGW